MRSGRYEWLGWGRMATDDLAESSLGLAERVEQLEPVNGRPEPQPYRYQARAGWKPSDVKIYANEYQHQRAERAEWASANAALVAEREEE